MIPDLDIEYVTIRKNEKKVATVYLFFSEGKFRNCKVCGRSGREQIVVVLQIISGKKEISLESEKGKEIAKYVQKELLHGIGLCSKWFFSHSPCKRVYLRKVNSSKLWK